MPSKDLAKRTAKHTRWVSRNKDKVLAYERQRYKEDKAKGKRRTRNGSYLKKYGITEDHYLQMLEAQENRCALCKRISPGKRRLAVDHCHKTGKVRQLLCMTCNTGLGAFKDDRYLLTEAIVYLTRHMGSVT